MSFTDHAAARCVKGLRGTTQTVFYEIAHRTSDDDGLAECKVKVATLAKALGKAGQAIRVAIKELKTVKLIRTSRRHRKNGTPSCFTDLLTVKCQELPKLSDADALFESIDALLLPAYMRARAKPKEFMYERPTMQRPQQTAAERELMKRGAGRASHRDMVVARALAADDSDAD